MAAPADVAAVDRFLAGRKTLFGAPPEFGPSNFNRKGQFEWHAIWPIADDIGVVTTGQLRIVVRPGVDPRPSLSVIFNSQCVTRLDVCPADECEANAHWAEACGLPAIVCGPHIHAWEHNRGHLLSVDGWSLDCREPLPVQIRRFAQAFPALADRINLVLTPDQRLFEIPLRLV